MLSLKQMKLNTNGCYPLISWLWAWLKRSSVLRNGPHQEEKYTEINVLMASLFNSECCPFWTGQTRWILSVYFIKTLKMNGFLQCPKNSSGGHPRVLWFLWDLAACIWVYFIRTSPALRKFEVLSLCVSLPCLEPVCHWGVALDSCQAPCLFAADIKGFN